MHYFFVYVFIYTLRKVCKNFYYKTLIYSYVTSVGHHDLENFGWSETKNMLINYIVFKYGTIEVLFAFPLVYEKQILMFFFPALGYSSKNTANIYKTSSIH